MLKKHSWNSPKETFRTCDHPDCQEKGTCKAPKDKTLRDYFWFCPKHAAEYNKNWDFYSGLSADEIEEHLKNDQTWQRPTWKLGHGTTPRMDNARDTFGAFRDLGLGMDGKYTPPQPKVQFEQKYIEYAEFMELTPPVSKADVKRQYKKLAKKYHPDIAGPNNKAAEEMFKKLTDAYHYLMERVSL